LQKNARRNIRDPLHVIDSVTWLLYRRVIIQILNFVGGVGVMEILRCGKKIVYHGSTAPVEIPQIMKNGRMLDFGEGFYTTSNKEQAYRWAELVAVKRKSNIRVINKYEFDFDAAKNELTIISFDNPDEEWLEFVCQNRSGRTPLKPYDIAIGPVANDQVFTVVVLYEQGLLSREAAITELKVRELYNQILFHTEQSLNYCRYVQHTEIGGTSSGEK